MNTDNDGILRQLCRFVEIIRDNLGAAAVVLLGVLLLAAVVAGVWAFRWIRGTGSHSLRDLLARRQAIERHLREN
jgi:hypothetical protein